MKIFIFLLFISTTISYLVFPLSKVSKEITASDNQTIIIDKLSYSKLYITINIGSKNVNVKALVTQGRNEFIITGKNVINHKYNELDSESYFTNNEVIYFSIGTYNKGFLSTENFNIKNDTNNIQIVNDVNFILITETKYDSSDTPEGEIGLHLPYLESKEEYNFIMSLKHSNGTKSYNWYFDFDNFYKGEGKMVVDGFPDDLNKKYKHDNFISIYSPLKREYTVDWGLIFSDVYYDEPSLVIKNNVKSQFDFDLGLISATMENGGNMIESLFFNKYIEANICHRDTFGIYKEVFYYCNNTNQFDKKEFKSIYLKDKELGIIFELDYNDLFYTRNNYIYFLITFRQEKGDNQFWKLGELFLKKYYIVFNQQAKTVGYYQGMEKQKTPEEQKVPGNKFNVVILLSIIIVVLIIIIIVGVIIYIKKKPRKNRANELDDDNYIYEEKEENADNRDDKNDKLVEQININ